MSERFILTGEKVWKWEIEIADDQIIAMPLNARILTVQWQRNRACLWASCLESSPLVDRRIQILGTGHEARVAGEYIGTVLEMDGSLVWHVFDCGQELS